MKAFFRDDAGRPSPPRILAAAAGVGLILFLTSFLFPAYVSDRVMSDLNESYLHRPTNAGEWFREERALRAPRKPLQNLGLSLLAVSAYLALFHRPLFFRRRSPSSHGRFLLRMTAAWIYIPFATWPNCVFLDMRGDIPWFGDAMWPLFPVIEVTFLVTILFGIALPASWIAMRKKPGGLPIFAEPVPRTYRQGIPWIAAHLVVLFFLYLAYQSLTWGLFLLLPVLLEAIYLTLSLRAAASVRQGMPL